MTGGSTTTSALHSIFTACRLAAIHRKCAQENARTPNRNPIVRTPQRMTTSNQSPQNAAANPRAMSIVRCFIFVT